MILVCDSHRYCGHNSEASKTRYQRRSGREVVHSVSAMLDGEWGSNRRFTSNRLRMPVFVIQNILSGRSWRQQEPEVFG